MNMRTNQLRNGPCLVHPGIRGGMGPDGEAIVLLGGAVAGGLLVVGIDAPLQATKAQVGHARRRGQDVMRSIPSTRHA